MIRTYAEHRDPFDAPDGGLYLGVPEATYHGLTACCSSRLSLVRRPVHDALRIVASQGSEAPASGWL